MSAHLETRRDNYAVIIVKYNYDFNEDWNFTADQMVYYIVYYFASGYTALH